MLIHSDIQMYLILSYISKNLLTTRIN